MTDQQHTLLPDGRFTMAEAVTAMRRFIEVIDADPVCRAMNEALEQMMHEHEQRPLWLKILHSVNPESYWRWRQQVGQPLIEEAHRA